MMEGNPESRPIQGRDKDLKKLYQKLMDCVWRRDLRRAKGLVKDLSQEDRVAVSRLREEYNDESTLLFTAASIGDTPFVNFLLEECGADIEQLCPCNSGGVKMTPLVIAVFSRHPDVVKTLVRHGADVNAVCDLGTTAVHAASIVCNINIVRYLMGNGANIHQPDSVGTTCLMDSVCSTKICKFLVGHDASVNAVDNQGSSALHYAILRNRPASVKVLMEHGADPSICNKDGDDALQTAAFKGIPEIVEYLIQEMNPTPETKADAYSLLASTIMGNFDKEHALSFWIKSANVRMEGSTEDPNKASHVGPNATYNFAVEAKDVDSLTRISEDNDALHMQALLVRERILGRNHLETVKAVMLKAAHYADLHNYERWIDLTKYALHNMRLVGVELAARRQTHAILYTLCKTLQKSTTENPASVRFAEMSVLLGCIIDKICEFINSSSAAFPPELASLPQLAIYLVHLLCDMPLTNAETTRFKKLVRALVQTRLRVDFFGCFKQVKNSTLLHLSVDFLRVAQFYEYADLYHDDSDDGDEDGNEANTENMNEEEEEESAAAAAAVVAAADDNNEYDDDYIYESDEDDEYDDEDDEFVVTWPIYPSSAVVECLLTAGAAVNAVDSHGNTPLHVAVFERPRVRSKREDWKKKIELLLDHGAHVDMVNAKGKSVYNKLPDNVNVFNYVSLQCLAARAIRAHKLPYRGVLPRMLADFVEIH